MRVSTLITIACLTSLAMAGTCSASNANKLKWGENVGPVFAYVDQTDQTGGLTVRATPSPEGRPVGSIPLGTKIRGSNEFKNGWLKMKSPVGNTGWINLSFLKPRSFKGTVIKVDNQESCLPIREGPASSHEKISCAQIGKVLKFTGIMTTNNWLQLKRPQGWVDATSVQLPPEAPQAEWSNNMTRDPARPIESSANDKPVPTPPFGTLPDKASVDKTGVSLASKPSSGIAAPPPKAVQGKEVLSPVECISGWCVDYGNSKVTHKGKEVSAIECLKDETCASIVGQRHAMEATRKGIVPFGNFRLLASGVILDYASKKAVAVCRDQSGIDQKCVAKFLRKAFADVKEK